MCFPRIRSTVSDEVKDRTDATVGVGIGGREAGPLSQVAARVLPQVDTVCNDPAKALHDTDGRPLPLCIVMEK